jgi:hypothetical protein
MKMTSVKKIMAVSFLIALLNGGFHKCGAYNMNGGEEECI